MKIEKVHCFFEQSGIFKKAFKYYGIPAEDYDIKNDFKETDNVIDLFAEIEKCYDCKPSIFDRIEKDDLIIAFYPCIHFCDAKTLFFKGVHISQKKWSLSQKMKHNIEAALDRERFFVLLLKFTYIVDKLGIRTILENPYNFSGMTYLQNNYIEPTIVDNNRMLRGDFFVKPTGYWFFNFSPSFGFTYQKDKNQKIISKVKCSKVKGICSLERSVISYDYALNFINDFLFSGSLNRGLNLQQAFFDFGLFEMKILINFFYYFIKN